MMGWLYCAQADKQSGEEARKLMKNAEKMFYKAEEAKKDMGAEALTYLFGLRGE